MDKKKFLKTADSEDLKGFEEFIESQPGDGNFLPRGVGGGAKKNESGFEHFTFLANDAERLTNLKDILGNRLPFSAKFDQAPKLIKDQRDEIEILKKKIFELTDREDSPLRKSLSEIFNGFFEPPKTN
jgi:hypothetical protein